MATQRTLQCKVDDTFFNLLDQQAQEQGVPRNELVRQAVESFVKGEPGAAPDRSGQIVTLLQSLNQRMQSIEERDAHLAAIAQTPSGSVATAPDERIDQVLQWLQVLGQRLQRLEEKEEEPMVTQAELIAPDERIDQILQVVQGLGHKVEQLESQTSNAIAALRPSAEPSTPAAPPGTAVESDVEPEATSPLSAPPTPAAEPATPAPTADNQPVGLPQSQAVPEGEIFTLEQVYAATALDRDMIQFFADYLGISEIEAIETRTPWEYDYITGGFRRRQ